MVKQHLLSKLKRLGGNTPLEHIRGIEKFLEADDVGLWLDPFIRALTSSAIGNKTKADIRQYLSEATILTQAEVDIAIDNRLDVWADFFKKRNQEESLIAIEQLRAAMTPLLPF